MGLLSNFSGKMLEIELLSINIVAVIIKCTEKKTLYTLFKKVIKFNDFSKEIQTLFREYLMKCVSHTIYEVPKNNLMELII